MKHLIYLTIFSAFLVVITSCGTLLGKSSRPITLMTNQDVGYADVSVDGELHRNVTFPFVVKVKGKNNPSTIIATTNGYQARQNVNKKFDVATLCGNIFIGGLIGIAVDYNTGAIMKPESKVYSLNFTKGDYAIETPTKVIAEQPVVEKQITMTAKANNKVTGDGSTSLENTVIRWYIDSYPKGADVFTRVISSTPDVKNSNQNYVGTTPYETTEAFDIKGLSLNNAGDVQIEVTCEKPGYLSQKKRFNVLQAIDQKEISTKFNLVKDE